MMSDVQNQLFWLLPLCYRNTPTQAHPARYRLLRFLVFLLRYMLLGLLSLVNGATLNQRALARFTLTWIGFSLRRSSANGAC